METDAKVVLLLPQYLALPWSCHGVFTSPVADASLQTLSPLDHESAHACKLDTPKKPAKTSMENPNRATAGVKEPLLRDLRVEMVLWGLERSHGVGELWT